MVKYYGKYNWIIREISDIISNWNFVEEYCEIDFNSWILNDSICFFKERRNFKSESFMFVYLLKIFGGD